MGKKDEERKYWSGWIESAPREEIRALQERKLREHTRYIFANSKFWQDRFREAKITPDDVNTIDDLAKVPYMNKEVQAAHLKEENDDYGGFLCRPFEEVIKNGAKAFSTSGTTSKPRRFLMNMDEWWMFADAAARFVWTLGLRPGDVAFLPFPLSMWLAGWAFQLAFDKIGITCIPAGPPIDTKQRLEFIRDFRATATVTTPSYLLHMNTVAKEMGMDLKDLGIKFVCLGGEPLPDSTRKRIENIFESPGITRNFVGISEVSPPVLVGAECKEQGGFHCTFEDTMIYQFLKPDSSEPAKPGEESEMVLTCLEQETMITGFNFRTRDLCVYDDSLCKCGRTSPRFKIVGRADDMVKIRAINIFSSTIEDIIRKFPEMGDEFQLVIEKKGDLDLVTVKAEPLPEVDQGSYPELKKKLEGAIKDSLAIKLPVEFVAFGTLPRFELKAKRWLDLRPEEK
ncbi:MAG: AMP-binding protein [Desulfatiglandales bacterium]